MIDPTNVLLYSTRVACVTAIAAVVFAAVRVNVATVRYGYWRAVLALSLLLAWIPMWPSKATTTGMTSATANFLSIASTAASLTPASVIEWNRVVLPLLVLGVMFRLIWIAVGLSKLRRLRHAGNVAVLSEQDAAVRDAIATSADIRYVPGIGQPVTFGLRRPVVLLPEQVANQDADVRQAVLTHELLHVQRRDWAWVLGEELVRAVLWFHPAIWWLVSRVQTTREEVVDALAVRATGSRRAYMEALLAFADRMPPARAAAFARRRTLFRRMVLIAKEDVMSRRRLIASCAVMATVLLVTGWYSVRAFPLRQASEIGALERQANAVTPENPVPRRLAGALPKYPDGVAGVSGTVTVRVTLDASGHVAEARVPQMSSQERREGRRIDVSTVPADPNDGMARAAVDAVRQWQYEPPARAPLSFDVTMRFQPGAPTLLVGYGAAPPPPPPPPPPGQRDATGVVRGSGTRDAAAPPPPPPPPPPPVPPDWAAGALRVGGVIAAPQRIKDARPIYPPDAMAAKVMGVVRVEALIDPTGKISHTRVIESIPELDQAAVDAIEQWEFTPTLLNGVPQPVFVTMTVNFTLK
jgi:TonB family protein